MRMIHISLLRITGGPAPTTHVHTIDAVLWAHASPRHGLEHLRVRSSDRGADAVLFVRAATDQDALHRARSLVDRATSPLRSLGYTTPTAPPRPAGRRPGP